MLTNLLNNKKSSTTLLPPLLSGSTLKWIALLTMLIDHMGAVLLECGVVQAYNLNLPTAFSYETSLFFFQADRIIRQIGRISFPIFCFLLVEGFHYTSNRKKYALRLFLFALLSEIPFDLALQGTVLEFGYQNVMFTLLFGFLTLSHGKDKRSPSRTFSASCRIWSSGWLSFPRRLQLERNPADSHSPCVLLLSSGKNHCRLPLPSLGTHGLPGIYTFKPLQPPERKKRMEILLLPLLSSTFVSIVFHPIRNFPHLNC